MTKRWFSTLLFALFSLNACGSNPVVVPAAKTDLIAVLKTRPSLTQFTKSLEATGVATTLQESGNYTIFAPIDAVVREGALDEATIRHHILQERITFSDLAGESTSYTTLHADEIEIDATETIRIGDGLMVESDIAASNGVIHVIDKVLKPEEPLVGLNPNAANGGPVELAPSNVLDELTDQTQPAPNASAVVPAAPTTSQ
jgi:predicted small lipoprotein YifL